MARNSIVPEWTLVDDTDPHEDCTEAPCEDCLTVAAQVEDEMTDETWADYDEWMERMLAPL